ncbi:MAG: GGDEF domain-containing protein [Treponema sp.]|nr:GGDEF domain-containing protein [Candidatus Treponema caballi]
MKQKIAVLCSGWKYDYVTEFLHGMQQATAGGDIDIYVFVAYNFTELSGFPNFSGFSIYSIIPYEDFDGVVILADQINNARTLEKERIRTIKAGKTAVVVNFRMDGTTSIKSDDYTAAYEMMEHLIKEHGYTDFGYLDSKVVSSARAEQYKAFRTCMLDNNLTINMDHVFQLPSDTYNDSYSFVSQYIRDGNKLPEVLVCANDDIALGVYKAAEENGISIPEQLKVVGYDDKYFAKHLNPPLSTVKNNVALIGTEAAKRSQYHSNETKILKAKNIPVYRCSCGCGNGSLQEKNTDSNFYLSSLTQNRITSEFSAQMEKIEEVFTEAADVFSLLTNLESLFNKSHSFEGDNFSIFLKADWSSVLINSEENLPQNLSYGASVQSITSIINGKKGLKEIIQTRSLIPSQMESEGNHMYLFFPIFNHSYAHGYLVTKDNLDILNNNYAYTWTRTVGTNIERFRKKNMYKQMSQQFLKLSTRDALSGMLNRVGLDKLAKPFFAQNKKNGIPTILFFIDINSMKTINDKFGHLHGDLAVKTVAASVMQVVPKNWLCVRYGGDEFLVVGNTKGYNNEDYCSQITATLTKKTSTMKLPYSLTCSVGTMTFPPSTFLTLEQAVEQVDALMYEKKQAFHRAQGDRPHG